MTPEPLEISTATPGGGGFWERRWRSRRHPASTLRLDADGVGLAVGDAAARLPWSRVARVDLAEGFSRRHPTERELRPAVRFLAVDDDAIELTTRAARAAPDGRACQPPTSPRSSGPSSTTRWADCST